MNDDMNIVLQRTNHLLSFFEEWYNSMSDSEWRWIMDKCWKIACEDYSTGKLTR